MRKSVIVESQPQNIAGVPDQQAQSVVIDKLRKLIVKRRKDVSNSLIATGSPKQVRELSSKEFNAAVMNRLSETGKQGDEFRNDITKLIVINFGSELSADGFFHTTKVGSNFGLTYQDLQILEGLSSSQEDSGSVTGKEESSDGGVTTRNGENVGEILTGSAAVLDSVSGIINLFTGGGTQTSANNTLNTGNPVPTLQPTKPFPWLSVIIGLVVVGGVVGMIVYFKKKKK